VGSMTEQVTSHGLTPWVSGYLACASAVVITTEQSRLNDEAISEL
jgi:hypothetical protein